MSRTRRNGIEHGKLRALIYTRVSADKSKRFRSTSDQEKECRADCDSLGYEVVGVLCDNSIGASRYSRGERPAWAEALAMIARGEVDVLVLWEASRATRDLKVFAELKADCIEHGVLLCYGGEVYDMSKPSDAFRSGQDALSSEHESGKISERLLRTSRNQAAKGRPWGPCPIGYVRKYDATDGTLLGQFIDPITAPIVRELIEAVIAGQSLSSLSQSLNERGVPTKRAGTVWTNTTVRQVVMSPAYAGLRKHHTAVDRANNVKTNVALIEAEWEPIVSVEQHEHAVAVLSDPRRRVQKQNTRKHVLSGVAQCAVCLSTMSVLNVHNKGTRRYTCKRGQHTAIAADFLEANVLDALITRFESSDELSADNEPSDDVLRAQAEIDEHRATLKQAAAQLRNGLSFESFMNIEAELNARIAELERSLRSTPLPTTVAAMSAASDPKEFFDALSLDQQAGLLRSIMTIKVARCATPGSKRVDPDRIEIDFLV